MENFRENMSLINVIPNSGEIDQCIVRQTIGAWNSTPPCNNYPHETGLTAPQEPSPLSRQEHAQQEYTSHVTTWPISIIQMSCLAKNASNLTLHLLLIRYHTCTKINCSPPFSNLKTVHHEWCGDPTLTAADAEPITIKWHIRLNFKQPAVFCKEETISMINEMSKRHENEQFIHDIQMFNEKTYILMSGLLK